MFAGQASDTKSFHSSTTNVFPYTESSCDIENRVVQLTQSNQIFQCLFPGSHDWDLKQTSASVADLICIVLPCTRGKS